jgi:signal transduction histidine kinase
VKTAQARAETARLLEEVEAARARLHGLFDTAPAFVCALTGPEHVYEMWNPPYARLVGVGRPLAGLRVRDALPEVTEQGFIDLLDCVYRTGEPFLGNEVPVFLDRTADGRMVESFLNFTYQPRRGVDGAITGIDVFGFDVTEQVKARKEAELLSEQLRLADQRKDEFLAMLAHELRNPMSARPSLSSPTTLTRLTAQSSFDRLQATLCATPPPARERLAGFDVPETGASCSSSV